MSSEGQQRLIKPRTKAGKRALEKRAPKTIEEPRKALILYGNKTSQNIKDALVDIHKMKNTDAVKFTRKNDDIQPFESGGEVRLESHTNRQDCSLFAIGSHTKKRPNNLILGRMFDFRLYDMIEFGLTNFKPVREFRGATAAQLGNKPCFVFVGEAFENEPQMKQVKSLFLDYFRGRQVDNINLIGLDRVVYVGYTPDQKTVLFRQYSVKYKKSGTKVPRAELTEMGPSMDLYIRRSRSALPELEKEAMKQAKITKKKEKNVGSDMLEGKVGRVYMPKQDVGGMALRKMKGLKRERRETAANVSSAKKQRAQEGGDGDSD